MMFYYSNISSNSITKLTPHGCTLCGANIIPPKYPMHLGNLAPSAGRMFFVSASSSEALPSVRLGMVQQSVSGMIRGLMPFYPKSFQGWHPLQVMRMPQCWRSCKQQTLMNFSSSRSRSKLLRNMKSYNCIYRTCHTMLMPRIAGCPPGAMCILHGVSTLMSSVPWKHIQSSKPSGNLDALHA